MIFPHRRRDFQLMKYSYAEVKVHALSTTAGVTCQKNLGLVRELQSKDERYIEVHVFRLWSVFLVCWSSSSDRERETAKVEMEAQVIFLSCSKAIIVPESLSR